MKTLTLYLIRHGQTEWNVQGLMQGWGDSPLTAQGIHAARLTGRALCDIPFAAAYSSCLPRTITTARHILHERAAHVPLFQHTGLNEQHFGNWEGQKVDDIRATAEFQQLVSTPAEYRAAISAIDRTDGKVYRYLNFNEIEDYNAVAATVDV